MHDFRSYEVSATGNGGSERHTVSKLQNLAQGPGLNLTPGSVQPERAQKPDTLELGQDNCAQVPCCALSIIHTAFENTRPGDGSREQDQVLKRPTARVRSWGLLPLSSCVTSVRLSFLTNEMGIVTMVASQDSHENEMRSFLSSTQHNRGTL